VKRRPLQGSHDRLSARKQYIGQTKRCPHRFEQERFMAALACRHEQMDISEILDLVGRTLD
jgi:hypothetical protein